MKMSEDIENQSQDHECPTRKARKAPSLLERVLYPDVMVLGLRTRICYLLSDCWSWTEVEQNVCRNARQRTLANDYDCCGGNLQAQLAFYLHILNQSSGASSNSHLAGHAKIP